MDNKSIPPTFCVRTDAMESLVNRARQSATVVMLLAESENCLPEEVLFAVYEAQRYAQELYDGFYAETEKGFRTNVRVEAAA